MKRFTYLLFLVLLALSAHAQRAKYVFFFIGDGMGLNQVNTTEMYLGEQNGRIGTQPLTFASFPVAGMATTYSATNSITDSAAGGTALATGSKTYNGAIGVDPDKQTLTSVAEQAKRAGRKVGVTTSVSIDHATPASFYAHQPALNAEIIVLGSAPLSAGVILVVILPLAVDLPDPALHLPLIISLLQLHHALDPSRHLSVDENIHAVL